MKIYHLGADETVVAVHIPDGPMGASVFKKAAKAVSKTAKKATKSAGKAVTKAVPKPLAKAASKASKAVTGTTAGRLVAVAATGGAAMANKNIRKGVQKDTKKALDAVVGEVKLRIKQALDKAKGEMRLRGLKSGGFAGLDDEGLGAAPKTAEAKKVAQQAAERAVQQFVTKVKAVEIASATATAVGAASTGYGAAAAVAGFLAYMAKLIPEGATYVGKEVAVAMKDYAKGQASAKAKSVAAKALPSSVTKAAPKKPVTPARPAAPAPAPRPSSSPARPVPAAAPKPAAKAVAAPKPAAKSAPAKKGFVAKLLELFGGKKEEEPLEGPSVFGESEDPHGPFCYGYMISYLTGMLKKHDQKMASDASYRKQFMESEKAQRQHACVVESLKLALQQQKGGAKCPR